MLDHMKSGCRGSWDLLQLVGESLCPCAINEKRSDSGGLMLSFCPWLWNLKSGIMFHSWTDFFQRWFFNNNRAVLTIARMPARMYVFVSCLRDIIHTECSQYWRPDARHSSNTPHRILLLPVNTTSTLCWVEKYRLTDADQRHGEL